MAGVQANASLGQTLFTASLAPDSGGKTLYVLHPQTSASAALFPTPRQLDAGPYLSERPFSGHLNCPPITHSRQLMCNVSHRF